MDMVIAGTVLALAATFDSPALNVGLTIYDVTGIIPVVVLGPVAMPLLVGNTYFAKFTPGANKNYIAVKAVYTDNTLTTIDPAYHAATNSFFSRVDPEKFSGITGQVLPNDVITGIVNS